MWKVATGASIVIFPASAAFAEFFGPVVSVLDGDTIEVLHNQNPAGSTRLTNM